MDWRMRSQPQRRAHSDEQWLAICWHRPRRWPPCTHRQGQAAVEYLVGLAVAVVLVTASLAGKAPPLHQFLDAIASAWSGLLIALALAV